MGTNTVLGLPDTSLNVNNDTSWGGSESRAVALADLDGDGEVKVADLLILIGDWGPCSECDSDLDNDGEVKIADLLILIGEWGPCR